MTTGTRRPRDPERAARIVAAARDLLREKGVGSITHRSVAARAGVPLGSTTYYFTSIDDLLAQAIEGDMAAFRLRAHAAIAPAPGRTPVDRVLAFVRLEEEHGEEQSADIELYLAAFSRPALRPLALAWNEEIITVLRYVLPYDHALSVACLIDGATIRQSLLGPGGDMTQALLEAGITALLADLPEDVVADLPFPAAETTPDGVERR